MAPRGTLRPLSQLVVIFEGPHRAHRCSNRLGCDIAAFAPQSGILFTTSVDVGKSITAHPCRQPGTAACSVYGTRIHAVP